MTKFISSFCIFFIFNSCSRESEIFTLYRNSLDYPEMRIHVASFDANEDEKYNSENCDVAQKLFQAQPLVKVRFWCEKGKFRK